MHRRRIPFFALALAACGSSATPIAENPTAAPPKSVAGPSAQKGPPSTCRYGTQVAGDGLIDDFEAPDPPSLGGRTPNWWLSAAAHARITIPGDSFAESDGGPPGSKKAVHFAGKAAFEDSWGAAVAVNFSSAGFYDASKYAGLSFKIKSEKPNLNVRLKLADVATHPDGGQCQKECWNAFGKELIVGPAWQHVTLMWSDLAQQPDWGVPRPPAITQSKLKDAAWTIYPGAEFDFWLDEVKFIECK